MQAEIVTSDPNKPVAAYQRLEERILARDQIGASEVYYDLLRAGRPLTEMVGEAVRIHAPITHVPYHERIDNGFVNFVPNDHCLLSARIALRMAKLVPKEMAGLPFAQTIWYIPTALDIWNQRILRAPGHHAARKPGWTPPPGPPPAPEVFWPDQEPVRLAGSLQERLDKWMTLVHRGEVLEAYRVFLGLMQNPEEQRDVLAQAVFAGLMDVQDRALYNRSFTTGHKAFRARAMVELGNALGWENAHDVIYAGALDIAVGPRWYSGYEMAGNVVTLFIEGDSIHAMPYEGTTEKERGLLLNTEMLTRAESEALFDALLRQPEPNYIQVLSKLLLAGKSPRNCLDILQLGAAQLLLETASPNNFPLPQHCSDYLNTFAWFWDTFDHPQRIKLLFTAASYLNRAAWHQYHIGDAQAASLAAPAGTAAMSETQLLKQIEMAVLELKGPEAVAWTKAYLDKGGDRASLVQQLALLACLMGNDPHNQEIGHTLLEDYERNRSWDRERFLLAQAHHTATLRKYGNPLDCARNFGKAMGIAVLQ
jgi:hypothetical protein